jgi:hypothetical protein
MEFLAFRRIPFLAGSENLDKFIQPVLRFADIDEVDKSGER